jgi:hypothetical protein
MCGAQSFTAPGHPVQVLQNPVSIPAVPMPSSSGGWCQRKGWTQPHMCLDGCQEWQGPSALPPTAIVNLFLSTGRGDTRSPGVKPGWARPAGYCVLALDLREQHSCTFGCLRGSQCTQVPAASMTLTPQKWLPNPLKGTAGAYQAQPRGGCPWSREAWAPALPVLLG